MNEIPRVCAVHDMSGYGKCSLTIALPLLSSAGIEVCPLPTSILSADTGVEGFTFMDLTPELPSYIDHWRSIGLKFDCVYSGFLGSAAQIEIVKGLMQEARAVDGKPALKVVDPVMGDNGKIIPVYDDELFKQMKQLVGVSDITTPNITEGCILTDTQYSGNDINQAQTKDICKSIADLGAATIILTGVIRSSELINCVYENGSYSEYSVPVLPFEMHGTGDLFTSTLTAALIRGHSLSEGVKSASEFVREVMILSNGSPNERRRGIVFEPLLHTLHTGLFANR